MKLTVQTFTVHKKFALQISRGTTAQTINIWLRIQQDNIEGWGEASPFSIDQTEIKDSSQLLAEFEQLIPQLESFHPLQRQEISTKLQAIKVSSAIQASVDMALHDWLGKKAGLPLWQIWGLNRDRIVPISVTIGISSPEQAVARLKDWQDSLEVKMIKLKLGSPEGIPADKAMVQAIRQVDPKTKLTVDANGGWRFNDAVYMSHWLAEHGVEYIEQPLPVAEDSKLVTLSANSPLPIFVDESCFTSSDILRLADSVAGVNLKIMKTGGLTEAIKAIQIAKVCGLKIMFGCYSDSSLANTAMSHLAPWADYLDLDSHLNLIDDPFQGATIKEGRLVPNNLPGLGVNYSAEG
ncbi:dipeptide epimerase [Pleurocapsa sp. PCC 7319]|uniref:dipeptide epimerase n=1 Tax=Pleurocapsa sp. PCC 7319 TaxID=118161 RepID=UPI000345D59A|nr:dipeptide epimerase [Pleurocapsa sp. PCC 7319]